MKIILVDWINHSSINDTSKVRNISTFFLLIERCHRCIWWYIDSKIADASSLISRWSFFKKVSTLPEWWLWWSWWWIVFLVWLTNERRLALFPTGTIIRDPHHRESPTCRKQDLNLRRTWVRALLNEFVQ